MAALFDDGFLGRGVVFEHGVEALAAAIVRGSIDGALQVAVTFDDVRGSVGLVAVEGRVLLTSTLRVMLASWHALVMMDVDGRSRCIGFD